MLVRVQGSAALPGPLSAVAIADERYRSDTVPNAALARGNRSWGFGLAGPLGAGTVQQGQSVQPMCRPWRSDVLLIP